MRLHVTSIIASAGLLLAVWAGNARGQINLPFGPSNYHHDLQLFAPVELDLDNLPEDDYSGYFFEYNKLYWSYTGERVTVGSPDVTAFAEIIYYHNPQDLGDPPPPPHQITNTLHDVPPKAGFAGGNRYELGYRDGDSGWLVGVLDGPKLHQTEFHGFQRRAIDGGLPPFIDPDYTDGSDVGPGGGPVGEVRAFGFGSVPILFETPEGYLTGFRDYLINVGGAHQGTTSGPLMYVGSYGSPVFVEPLDIDDGAIFRRADDLNGNGIWGGVNIVDEDDNIIGFIVDFDDLHVFNIYFDNVTIRNTTSTSGIELMWSHVLSNQHYQAKRQNNRIELYWGARFIRLYDNFRVDAEGSILHDAFWDTSVTNQIVGPQVGARWQNRRGRWTTNVSGRFLFGYNIQDWRQNGLMGEGLIPGALNQPLYGRPTAFAHGLQERDFSPVAELRLETAYHFTRSVALKLGLTSSFIGNIRRAATSVHYRLPDMGYRDVGTQDILVNGVDFGVEFVH